MAVSTEFQAAIDALDAATDKLGTGVANISTAVDQASIRIAAIMATLSTSMTATEVAAAKATLDTETNRLDNASLQADAIATALNGLAADATQPVPAPVPEPVVVPSTPVV